MKRERLTLIPIEYLFIVFGSTQKGTSQKSRNNNIDAFCKRRAIIMIFSTYGSEPSGRVSTSYAVKRAPYTPNCRNILYLNKLLLLKAGLNENVHLRFSDFCKRHHVE